MRSGDAALCQVSLTTVDRSNARDDQSHRSHNLRRHRLSLRGYVPPSCLSSAGHVTKKTELFFPILHICFLAHVFFFWNSLSKIKQYVCSIFLIFRLKNCLTSSFRMFLFHLPLLFLLRSAILLSLKQSNLTPHRRLPNHS